MQENPETSWCMPPACEITGESCAAIATGHGAAFTGLGGECERSSGRNGAVSLVAKQEWGAISALPWPLGGVEGAWCFQMSGNGSGSGSKG